MPEPKKHPSLSEVASTRNSDERMALDLLCYAIQNNVLGLLRHGIISRWLSQYPLAGEDTDINSRRKAVEELKSYNGEDFRMIEIVVRLNGVPEGRKQLRKHGLLGSGFDETDMENDVVMVGGEGTAGLTAGRPSSNTRLRDESSEEQALRRRRREAMVISEGGRPLGQSNIIQRQEPTRDPEMERELESLMAEVIREEQELRE